MSHEEHYKEDYFKWYSPIGQFGGWACLDKFIDYVEDDFRVLDFGSGGGYLLNNLKCREKIGIEINEVARKESTELGVKTVKYINEIEDDWADLIISNNSLEHTTHPLNELKDLYKKLKSGRKIVFVVPCESIEWKYAPGDINYHLYSWSPMSIGNLFTEAGFKVIESKAYKHKWPPYYGAIAKHFGRKIFNIACRIYARIETSWYQVRIVAEKS